MSLFIEVESEEKNCKIIVNLDTVIEIAPLRSGGCHLFFADSAAVGGKTAMKVKDSYALFQQFVLQTVSPDDIAKRIQSLSKIEKEPHPRFISDAEVTPNSHMNPPKETLQENTAPTSRRGRPPKSGMVTTADLG
jgi:hypothetical protein